jgi:urate oxidase
MSLSASSYGKARVRTLRVHRDGDSNEVRELSTDVILHGAFDRAYTDADNHAVIATDSIKNIVNIVARENLIASAEQFCENIAERFLSRYPQVSRVTVQTHETKWTRLSIGGIPHKHGFVLDANGKPTARLDRDRSNATLHSGIAGFTFMKSTGSGWADYVHDEYATLSETQDRIAATSMDATWLWHTLPADPATLNEKILTTMLDVFANTYSHGIQDSLYRMGQAALQTVPDIAEIHLACPNKHYLPINLAPFGLNADNCVFTPTDEPHGQIACTVRR